MLVFQKTLTSFQIDRPQCIVVKCTSAIFFVMVNLGARTSIRKTASFVYNIIILDYTRARRGWRPSPITALKIAACRQAKKRLSDRRVTFYLAGHLLNIVRERLHISCREHGRIQHLYT